MLVIKLFLPLDCINPINHVLTLADVVVTVESSKCYGKSDCSLHLMNCSARHRMSIKEAAYYFQTTARFTQCGGAVNAVPPYCMDDCCR